MKHLHQRFALHDLPSEVFTVQFSPDGSLLACGCNDGSVRVYHAHTGALTYTIPAGSIDPLPVTALRWRPGGGKTKNVLITTSADTTVKTIHVSTQRVLSKFAAPDQMFALDVHPDGEQFAVAGRDKNVYIYSGSGTGSTPACTLRAGGFDTPGHSNRVFSVKWDTSDTNRLVSGGWDNCVIMWDVRSGRPERTYYGPHVCGDSLDIHGNVLLAGSWAPEKQLRMYDIRGKGTAPLVELSWNTGGGSSATSRSSSTLVYAARFNAAGTYMAAGGSGSNEAKLFDVSRTTSDIEALAGGDAASASISSPGLTGTIAGLTRSVYSVDFDNEDGLVLGGGDFLCVFDIVGAGAAASAPASSAGTFVTSPPPSSAPGRARDPVKSLPMQLRDAPDHAAAAAATFGASPREVVDEAAVIAAYGGEEETPAAGPDDE